MRTRERDKDGGSGNEASRDEIRGNLKFYIIFNGGFVWQKEVTDPEEEQVYLSAEFLLDS